MSCNCGAFYQHRDSAECVKELHRQIKAGRLGFFEFLIIQALLCVATSFATSWGMSVEHRMTELGKPFSWTGPTSPAESTTTIEHPDQPTEQSK